jgi:hypothetical protein
MRKIFSVLKMGSHHRSPHVSKGGQILPPALTLGLLLCFFIGFTEAQSKKPTTKKTENYKTAREGVGVDGITVGRSTADEVIKKFGKNYVKKTYGKYSFSLNYSKLGMVFYYCQTDKKKEIFDIELRAPYKAKTSKGIILGKSTVEDVRKIYGKSRGQASGEKEEDLEYAGVSFFSQKIGGKKIITVIDIVEAGGIRQCKEAK